MKTKTKYTEEPMGELRIIKDFLPKPDKLALKEENVKITISLKKSSIDFFKKKAKKHKHVISEDDKSGNRLVCFTVQKAHNPAFGTNDLSDVSRAHGSMFESSRRLNYATNMGCDLSSDNTYRGPGERG